MNLSPKEIIKLKGWVVEMWLRVHFGIPYLDVGKEGVVITGTKLIEKAESDKKKTICSTLQAYLVQLLSLPLEKTHLRMYHSAIEKAVQYIRSNIDQDYCLPYLEGAGSAAHPDSSHSAHRRTVNSESVLTSKSNHQQGDVAGLSNGNCNGKASEDKEAAVLTEDEPKQPKIANSLPTKNSAPMKAVKLRRKRKRESSTPSGLKVVGIDLTPTNKKQLKTTSPLVEELKHDSCTPSPGIYPWVSSTPASHLTAMAMDSEDEGKLDLDSDSNSDDDLPVVDLSMKETVGC